MVPSCHTNTSKINYLTSLGDSYLYSTLYPLILSIINSLNILDIRSKYDLGDVDDVRRVIQNLNTKPEYHRLLN